MQAFFSTAAFRFGHSMVPSFLWSMGAGKGEPTFIPVRDSFFAPQFVDKDGIDGILRGAAQHVCKEIDHKVHSTLLNPAFIHQEFDTKIFNPFVFMTAIHLYHHQTMLSLLLMIFERKFCVVYLFHALNLCALLNRL